MTRNDIELLIKESEEFITNIIQRKYCHDGEKQWQDITTRFGKLLSADKKENWLLKDLPTKIPQLMSDKKYLPAGSVLYGFGCKKNVSLSNCYHESVEEDSLEGIYDYLSRQARTYSHRGGVGTDFAILRPKGTPVNNSAETSSGSVSFMPLSSENTNIIGQNGRRGANIITTADWHPDVTDFVICKSEPDKVFDYDYINNYLPHVYYANISVRMSDAFFEAYESDGNWDFVFPDIYADKKFYNKNWNGDLSEWKEKGGKVVVYKTIKAKELLKLIAQSAWKGAEPGLLYWDNALKYTPLAMLPEYKPRGVNPCGEQILGNHQSCNLHAVNLSAYVKDPFTKHASFDVDELVKDICYVHEFADYVVTINKHPLKAQQEVDREIRKVGIEFTGLGDTFAMLGLKYGDNKSIDFIHTLFSKLVKTLWENNIRLAEHKGKAPVFDDSVSLKKFLGSPYFKRLEKYIPEMKQLKDRMLEKGLRNTALLNNGPTGTISIVANNCTSGIEPLFKLAYTRKSRLLDKETTLIHLPLMKWLANNAPEDFELPLDKLKEKYNYVEADELDYKQRIDVQSALQIYFTDSISSTINLPETATPDDIEKIYLYGWQKELKGVTVYRAGSLTGILESTDKKDKTEEKKTKIKIPEERLSFTYTMLWKRTKVYITIPYVDDHLVEIFAKLPPEASYDEKGNKSLPLKLEREANWTALCRVISTGLKYHIPTYELIKALDKSSNVIGDLPNILSRTLKKSLQKLNHNQHKDTTSIKGEICPVCGSNSLVQEGGCKICKACGYSKCE